MYVDPTDQHLCYALKILFHVMEHSDLCFIVELHDIILDHIRNLFMTSGIELKCSIIGMLNKFVQNLVSVYSQWQLFYHIYEGSMNLKVQYQIALIYLLQKNFKKVKKHTIY